MRSNDALLIRAAAVGLAIVLGGCSDQLATISGPTDPVAIATTAASDALSPDSHWTVDEVDLGSLGLLTGDAMDINVSGRITGWSTSLVGAHTFVWTRGAGMTDIEPNGPESVGVAINRFGHVGGYYGSPPAYYDAPWTGPREAYFWNGRGAPQRLGIPNSWVTGMNDEDELVGMANGQAFYWSPRQGIVRLAPPPDPFIGEILYAADITPKGEIATTFYRASSGNVWVVLFDRHWRFISSTFGKRFDVRLHSVNAAGKAVGADVVSDPIEGRRAFYHTTPIPPVTGGVANEALGVNDLGVVVGWSEFDRTSYPGRKTAFAWRGNGVLKLRPSPTDESVARAVNPGGQIVGSIISGGGAYPRLWIVRQQ